MIDDPEEEAWRQIEAKGWPVAGEQSAPVPSAVDRLRAFAKDVLGDWPEGGSLDGFEIQELAIKHGLLEATTQYKPCVEEGCFCASMLTPEEFESGVTCYRRTALLKGA